ncbi:MAG: methionyl-tRNA formyltransferase [Candidatus Saccharimonadales bacterium]
MSKPTVFFFGNEQLAQGLERAITPTFEALVRDGYEISALVLPSENTKKPLKITEVAAKHGVPVFYTRNSAEILELIEEKKPDVGVLASFGKIIPQAVIEAFPYGILNIHPSLLPKYRGTTPIESAILNGDKETGVSVMQLAKEMDAGPIFAQKEVTLSGTETKQELYEELASIGAELLSGVLKNVVKNTATPKIQGESHATFTKMLFKKDGRIDPEKHSAAEIERQVRAYAGFPKSKYEYFGLPCTITAVHVADGAQTELDLKCKGGDYLCIDKLIPAGRKEMAVADFLRGYSR